MGPKVGRFRQRRLRRPLGDVSSESPDAQDGAKLLGHVVQLFFWEIRGQSIDVDIRRMRDFSIWLR